MPLEIRLRILIKVANHRQVTTASFLSQGKSTVVARLLEIRRWSAKCPGSQTSKCNELPVDTGSMFSWTLWVARFTM